MTFEEHKIFYIDDYILERNKGNEFLSLIEHYFREKKLTFSLLEMVLLYEKGVGETYIWAMKEFDAKGFYEKYYALVNKFKDEFEGGVSSYKEWYFQNTWIFIGEGEKSNTSYSIKYYDWLGEFEPRDIKKYGEKDGLTQKIILDYFNKYAAEFEKIELNKHPHYFIIIHPICKSENDKILPYGNLYLHFATIEKVEIETVKDFLRAFMIIWYKCYGGHNHKAIINKLVQKILSNKEITRYLPYEFGTHKDELQILFMQYFIKNSNLVKFNTKAEELLLCLTEIKSKKETDDFATILKYKKAPSFNDLLNNFNEDDFESFLLKRALGIFLFVCKKFSVESTKKILMKKESTAKNKKSDLDYFYQYLHIYFSENQNDKKLRENLETSDQLSAFEKTIITKFSEIQET